MTTPISSHVSCDDQRHFRFERNSHLPLDTFKRSPRITADAVVFVVCAVAAVVVALFLPT
jgi:hypothetical protein